MALRTLGPSGSRGTLLRPRYVSHDPGCDGEPRAQARAATGRQPGRARGEKRSATSQQIGARQKLGWPTWALRRRDQVQQIVSFAGKTRGWVA